MEQRDPQQCLRFGALREYVVGRTLALPVLVYDYYEPAFKATRFYISTGSLLTRELCAWPTCNKVERTLALAWLDSPGSLAPRWPLRRGRRSRDAAAPMGPWCAAQTVWSMAAPAAVLGTWSQRPPAAAPSGEDPTTPD
ncbi:C3 and PZP-like alpha-2-macroglobulin domain-containing protein 8, partial [Lemur catta]|uniref:C3 and PZP-like alpha-2-macroglobulin domain-containing protein 8 n=1 Tax=Lemur catta TaxID=9447 RepID=UPI001E26B07A